MRLDRIINEAIRKVIYESFKNNDNYSHFAVNKSTGKIVNGWDYWEENPSDLKQDKKYYFYNDLKDNGLDPMNYYYWSDRHLRRQGIDPDDNDNWANE